jgi:hypothetical protein
MARRRLGHAEEADERVRLRRRGRGLRAGGAERPLHVALPARDPQVAHHDVAAGHRVGAADLEHQRIGPARQGTELDAEAAALPRDGLAAAQHRAGCVAELGVHLLAGLRRAEDADRHVALQHHAVAEDRREGDVGRRRKGVEGDQEGGDGAAHGSG